jgi:tRNA threonylcarbamoyladenosine biosynthesis protein TsaB
VLDARRGEAFAAAWADPGATGDGSAPPLIAPAAVAPERLAEIVRDDGGWLAVGDGALRFRRVLEAADVVVAQDARLHRVSALEHCRLAAGVRPQDPDSVVPEYLRVPDAELALRARAGAGAT